MTYHEMMLILTNRINKDRRYKKKILKKLYKTYKIKYWKFARDTYLKRNQFGVSPHLCNSFGNNIELVYWAKRNNKRGL